LIRGEHRRAIGWDDGDNASMIDVRRSCWTLRDITASRNLKWTNCWSYSSFTISAF